MNYLLAQQAFLYGCGDPTGEDRKRALAAFDTTLLAQMAKFQDDWAQLWDEIMRPFK